MILLEDDGAILNIEQSRLWCMLSDCLLRERERVRIRTDDVGLVVLVVFVVVTAAADQCHLFLG